MGQTGSGMQTMNQALLELVKRRMIALDEAYANSGDVDELRAMVEGKPYKR
jgi:Tfp pilus assembly ATPase PilU